MSLRDLTPWRKNRATSASDLASPFSAFQQDLDSIFGDSFPSVFSQFADENGKSILPARVDMSESDDEIEIIADMPGMDEKDIDITFQDNVLTLKGERKSESEDKNRQFTRVERSHGTFVRRIAIPTEIQEEDIKADFSKGVLKIILPKSHDVRKSTRKIEVRST